MPTRCTFQGFPLVYCEYRNGRGYRPGGALMRLPVDVFPVGFDFRVPKPGDLSTPKALPGVVVDSTLATADTPSGPAPLAKAFDYEGFLVMSETVGGTTWEHPPVRLFVTSVATVKQANGGRALVEVRASDVRFHWDHGWCRRHSYNRRRADGSIALDSVGEDGKPVNRKQVAADVCSCLFRAPKLSRAPSDWLADTSSVQFVPNAPPVVNLAQMVNTSDLAEPCLFLDESVALFRTGEGMVGYARSPGEPNSQEFPLELRLDKQGTGQQDLIEWQYPEDYVLVAGGLKVATVALDDCNPVLDVEGVTVEINDENIRRLTGGKFDTAWLRRFVFLPADFAGAPDLPEPIAYLFRTQAYRLWQIPGAERDVLADAPDEEGRTVREPGPNAHLLPVLARAETTVGRRWQPSLETYTFAMRHRALGGGAEIARQQAAIREIAKLRAEITSETNRQGKGNPFAGSTARFGGTRDAVQLDPRQFVDQTDEVAFLNAGGDLGELMSYVNQARMVDRIAEQAGGGFAQQYEAALKERFAAEDEAGGFSSRMYEAAKRFLDLEKRAKATAGGGLLDAGREKLELDAAARETIKQAFRDQGYAGAFAAEIQALTRELLQRQEEKRRLALVGGSEGSRVASMVFFQNVARTTDAAARVYDPERGIFESGGLAGHLVTPEVHDLSHPDAQLSVCPVRAVFGAHVRPRLDVPYRSAARQRVQTGSEANPRDPEPGESVSDCPGGDNVIPKALEDADCYFLSAFKRGPSGGAVPIRVEEIPPGQALVIRRPDLVELVRLDGASNRAQLELEAAREAAELFKTKPLVRTKRITVARPWPVNCDGVVEAVEIRLRERAAGFETTVITGAGGSLGDGGTREDPARRGAAALRAQNEAAKRERVAQ